MSFPAFGFGRFIFTSLLVAAEAISPAGTLVDKTGLERFSVKFFV